MQTTSASDFWLELKTALEAIIEPGKDGRSVTISPQSGVIVIRAMPDELRNVDQYLRATQLSVDRQVILEAKILEVELNSNFQSGINWAAFGKLSTNSRISAGLVPDFTARAALAPGRAVRILADWTFDEPHAGTVHAVYMPGPHLALKVRAMIDYLVAEGAPGA